MRTHLLSLVAFAAFGLSAFAAPAGDKDRLLLEFADGIMKKECADCPGYVGQMIGARPIKLGDVKEKSEIIVEDCHVTLVAPDRVRTASHCLRRWNGPSRWENEAQGDCGKAYGFYFPATNQYPQETLRCKKILSPISAVSGVPQLEPDDIEIQLHRTVQRETAAVDIEPIKSNDEVVIWGYDGEGFKKRACRQVRASILTPLDETPGSAYTTLTCDGEVTPGWSGDGAFVNGKLKAIVSFGVSATTYGLTFFGSDEVAVSQALCSASGLKPLAKTCLATAEQLEGAIYERYSTAIDKTPDWIAGTVELIRGRIPYAELKFKRWPVRSGLFLSTPGLDTHCYHREALPTAGRIFVSSPFQMETFRGRYVEFNPDTTIRGVSRRNFESPESSVGQFNIGLNFQWSAFEKLEDGVRVLEPEVRTIPYCP